MVLTCFNRHGVYVREDGIESFCLLESLLLLMLASQLAETHRHRLAFDPWGSSNFSLERLARLVEDSKTTILFRNIS